MVSAPTRSLARLSRFAVFWYSAVLGGWTLLAIALYQVATTSLVTGGAPLAMSATLLVALELLPLVQGRGHDPQGVVMSTAFVCSMLVMWGPWPAIVMVSIAAAAADLRAKKVWWKAVFNVGQYSASVWAAYLVIWFAGPRPSLAHPLPRFHIGDLGWIVGVWVVYFTVNLVIVTGAVSYPGSFWKDLFEDFWHYTVITFAVLGLSPVIVVVAQNAWLMLPPLLIPLLLLYAMAQLSLEKEHEAGHDALTGLPNRATMHFALTNELTQRHTDTHRLGLLLIDLDHFKEVNDTLGHHVGDELLVRVAARLTKAVRAEDHVARLGGDEFAVIIPDADEAKARAVAERIRVALAEPIHVQTMSLQVEASIGLAMYPEHGGQGEELLRHADVAMYTAKESRQGIALYDADRDRNSPDRLSLLGEMRQALDEHTLRLHYQPKVSLSDGSLLGVEALIRWKHPQRGYIPPDEFIPLAERTGIMPLLTERVISMALGQLREWSALGLHIPIAVNISPTDLAGHRLTDLLASGLVTNDVAAHMLQLEITERVVAEETDELNSVLMALHQMGVTLSIDDFGTGYSSLLRLKNLPVSELKIDRVFVSNLCDSQANIGIVRAVIDVAHALGMPAIAEGIETEDVYQVLRSLGCDGGQGWHIARPMAAPEATEWILAHLAAPSPREADPTPVLLRKRRDASSPGVLAPIMPTYGVG